MKARTLLAGLASYLRGGAESGGLGSVSMEVERLPELREKLADKNRRLKKLREQLQEKDEELTRLQEVVAARDAGDRRGIIDLANIVWIFGTARTGSTWLSSIMAS